MVLLEGASELLSRRSRLSGSALNSGVEAGTCVNKQAGSFFGRLPVGAYRSMSAY